MAKELSDLLADLSHQAKEVEDAFAAIAEETDARAAERRDRTRAAATAAINQVDEGISTAEVSVAEHWRGLTSLIQAEVKDMQEASAERQHQRDVGRAEADAKAAQERAARAVAFAAAAVQTAGAAVLDAAVARREAEAVKRG